jgi:hypothetical protein
MRQSIMAARKNLSITLSRMCFSLHSLSSGACNIFLNLARYTWGRWPGREGGPVLPVKNITWEIPPVDAAHFTVEELVKALEVVGEGVEYVWIDIACMFTTPSCLHHSLGLNIGEFGFSREKLISGLL